MAVIEEAPGQGGLVLEPGVVRLVLADTRVAPLWLLIRLYVGYAWLRAGWEKLGEPTWIGAQAGSALGDLIRTALLTTARDQAATPGWYANVLRDVVLPHAAAFSYAITFGEILAGLGVLLGLVTGVAAFWGSVINASFLLAGTASTDPVLFILAVGLMLAWRVAGYYGLDRWLLPLVGVPGVSSVLLRRRPVPAETGD